MLISIAVSSALKKILWIFNRNFEMSGNKIFLDTNILLYLLAGDETIAELLNG